MADFLLGADPEFIIIDPSGAPVSSEGLIGHGKDSPIAIDEEVGVHEDNILVEFNIAPATSSIDFLKKNVKALYLINLLFLKDKNLLISQDCYADFDPQYLDTEQAQAVGCSPEFDAISGDILDPPVFEDGSTGRSAGGHVHIGYPNENLVDSMMIVKMLDLHLGVPSLVLDKDTKRRRLYGKASSYRRNEGLKVEYRTLSNFWLFNKKFIEWVYEVCAKVVNEVLSGTVIDDDTYMRARQVINTNDKAAAEELIIENALLMPYGEDVDIVSLLYGEEGSFIKDFVLSKTSDIEIIAEDAESDFEQQVKRPSSKRLIEPAVMAEGGRSITISDVERYQRKSSKSRRTGTSSTSGEPGVARTPSWLEEKMDMLDELYTPGIKPAVGRIQREVPEEVSGQVFQATTMEDTYTFTTTIDSNQQMTESNGDSIEVTSFFDNDED